MDRLAVSRLEPDTRGLDWTRNAIRVHTRRQFRQPEGDGIGQERGCSAWKDFRITSETERLFVEVC